MWNARFVYRFIGFWPAKFFENYQMQNSSLLLLQLYLTLDKGDFFCQGSPLLFCSAEIEKSFPKRESKCLGGPLYEEIDVKAPHCDNRFNYGICGLVSPGRSQSRPA